MRVRIGYSRTVDFADMQRLVDIDPSHPRGFSRFRRTFLSGRITPGDYEIYTPGETGFSEEGLRERFPFEVPQLALFDQDLSEASIVFCIQNEKAWLTDHALGLYITDEFSTD
ncbi:MAG: hypothetical protein AB8I08_16850 [Sandaracinaceae bacterium]